MGLLLLNYFDDSGIIIEDIIVEREIKRFYTFNIKLILFYIYIYKSNNRKTDLILIPYLQHYTVSDFVRFNVFKCNLFYLILIMVE